MAASDKSLLDRLNALKPSGISLSGSSQIPRTGLSSAEATAAAKPPPGTATGAPASREDALAARLRTLRGEQDEQDDVEAQLSWLRTAGPEKTEKTERTERIGPVPDTRQETATASGLQDADGHGHGHPLLATVDEHALDDLLLELAATNLADEDAADEQTDDDPILLPDVPVGLEDGSGDESDDEEASEKKVADLLRDLGGPNVARQDGGRARAGADSDDSDDSDDTDDVDGNKVGQVVDVALAQAKALTERTQRRQDWEGGSAKKAAGAEEEGAKKIPEAEAGSKENSSFLTLPAVPTKLVDPPPDLEDPAAADGDIDSTISVRLAALRGLHGKAAGLGQTDAFGLPSAPTFQPGAATSSRRTKTGLHYTDADQQTWCIVCLEDATVRCLGCSDGDGDDDGVNNAYCARCWRDMHVGPAAGFDERGHQRVPLVRRQGP